MHSWWRHCRKLRCCSSQARFSNVRSPAIRDSHNPLSMISVPPLHRRHLRVALIDSSWPTRLTGSSSPTAPSTVHYDHLPAPLAESRDRRVYAISPASRQLLQAVGAWQLLPADSVHNYDSMQVPSRFHRRLVCLTRCRCGRRLVPQCCS